MIPYAGTPDEFDYPGTVVNLDNLWYTINGELTVADDFLDPEWINENLIGF